MSTSRFSFRDVVLIADVWEQGDSTAPIAEQQAVACIMLVHAALFAGGNLDYKASPPGKCGAVDRISDAGKYGCFMRLP